MPELVESPSRVPVPGGKVIDEYAGRASSGDDAVSVAVMTAPPGWSEPAQAPDFDEVTVVLSGALMVEHAGGALTVDGAMARPAQGLQSGQIVAATVPTPAPAIEPAPVPFDVVYEDDDVLAFRDMHPQAPVHVLVIPREHIATLNDVDPAHAEMMGKLFLAAKKVAGQEGLADRGYRTVVNCNAEAGQSVYHVHMHVLAGRPMTWPPG